MYLWLQIGRHFGYPFVSFSWVYIILIRFLDSNPEKMLLPDWNPPKNWGPTRTLHLLDSSKRYQACDHAPNVWALSSRNDVEELKHGIWNRKSWNLKHPLYLKWWFKLDDEPNLCFRKWLFNKTSIKKMVSWNSRMIWLMICNISSFSSSHLVKKNQVQQRNNSNTVGCIEATSPIESRFQGGFTRNHCFGRTYFAGIWMWEGPSIGWLQQMLSLTRDCTCMWRISGYVSTAMMFQCFKTVSNCKNFKVMPVWKKETKFQQETIMLMLIINMKHLEILWKLLKFWRCHIFVQ